MRTTGSAARLLTLLAAAVALGAPPAWSQGGGVTGPVHQPPPRPIFLPSVVTAPPLPMNGAPQGYPAPIARGSTKGPTPAAAPASAAGNVQALVTDGKGVVIGRLKTDRDGTLSLGALAAGDYLVQIDGRSLAAAVDKRHAASAGDPDTGAVIVTLGPSGDSGKASFTVETPYRREASAEQGIGIGFTIPPSPAEAVAWTGRLSIKF